MEDKEKTTALCRRLLWINFNIVGGKELVIQKIEQGHIKSFGKHHNCAERYGFVSPVHDALEASVLDPRRLFQTVLCHVLFVQ